MENKGLRNIEGKNRLDLVSPDAIESIGKVLTKGAEKYSDRNWEKGLKWSDQILGSLGRHLNAIQNHIDEDPEFGLSHAEHLLVNAMMLIHAQKHFPWLDNRPLKMTEHPKIALDVDGVLADFDKAAAKDLGVKRAGFWKFTYKMDSDWWKRIVKDKEFWVDNMPVLSPPEDLGFEPECYVTSRPIPKEWTEEWLETNGFPCVPAYTLPGNHNSLNGVTSKVKILKKENIDIFVDDYYKVFIECTKAGIFTYLFSRPYNEKFYVGHRRVKSLRDVWDSRPETQKE